MCIKVQIQNKTEFYSRAAAPREHSSSPQLPYIHIRQANESTKWTEPNEQWNCIRISNISAAASNNKENIHVRSLACPLACSCCLIVRAYMLHTIHDICEKDIKNGYMHSAHRTHMKVASAIERERRRQGERGRVSAAPKKAKWISYILVYAQAYTQMEWFDFFEYFVWNFVGRILKTPG